jgi:hypothetical protein
MARERTLRRAGSVGVSAVALTLGALGSASAGEVEPGRVGETKGCDDLDLSGAECTAHRELRPGDVTLRVHFVAPPTVRQLEHTQQQLHRASMGLCDATEGVFRLRRIVWTTGEAGLGSADLVWYPQGVVAHVAAPGGPLGAGGKAYFGSATDVLAPRPGLPGFTFFRGDTITHELGHLLLGLGDSYLDVTQGFGPAFENPSPPEPFNRAGDNLWAGYLPSGDASERAHTIMQQVGMQVCVSKGSGLSPYQEDPLRYGKTEHACLVTADCGPEARSGDVQLVNVSGYSKCPDVGPLASELSSPASEFDLLAGSGSESVSSCPPARPTREVILRGSVPSVEGWPNGCPHDVLCPDGATPAPCVRGLIDYTACPAPESCGDGVYDAEAEDCEPGMATNCRDLGLRSASGFWVGCSRNCSWDRSSCAPAWDPDLSIPIRDSKAHWALATTVRDGRGAEGNYGASTTDSWFSLTLHWLYQGPSAVTLIFEADFEDGGGLHRLAVWDVEFDGDGWVEEVNGRSYDPEHPPTLVLGSPYVVSTHMQSWDDDARDYAEPTGPLPGGGEPLELTVRLEDLQLVAASAGAPPVLYGRWGETEGTTVTLRNGASAHVANTDILASDAMQSLGLCQASYNVETQRFEGSSQLIAEANAKANGSPVTAAHIKSVETEWDAVRRYVTEHYGLEGDFGPRPLVHPNVEAPPHCGVPPQIVPPIADAVSPAELVFALDRSGSMGARVSRWVTGQTRLDFVKAGMRAMLDDQLARRQADRASVGALWFSGGVVSGEEPQIFAEPSGPLANGAAKAHLRDSTDPAGENPTPLGSTDICGALASAYQLGSEELSPSSRAIVLLSDGENTVGGSAGDFCVDFIKDLIASHGVQIHTMPVALDGGAGTELRAAASHTGGLYLPTEVETDVPVSFFELAANQSGQPLAKHFSTPASRIITGAGESGSLTEGVEEHEIEVEAGAKALRILVSATDGKPVHPESVTPVQTQSGFQFAVTGSLWDPVVTLRSPSGQVVSAVEAEDPFYRLLEVEGPAPGVWKVRFKAGGLAQMAAYVENSEARAEVHADISTVDAGGDVLIYPRAYGPFPLSSGVTYRLEVVRPDDSRVTVPVRTGLNGAPRAVFARNLFRGRGFYRAIAHVEAGPNARFARNDDGKPIPVPRNFGFTREPSVGFYLDLPEDAPLPTTGRRAGDCDLDGIPNEDESAGDFDGDGAPDVCDGDADADDVPDISDSDPRNPDVPVARSCPDAPASVACCESISTCTGASEWALYADGLLDIRDRVRVETSSGAPAASANAGAGQTTVGAQARTGSVYASGPLMLRSGAFLDGDARAGSGITEQNDVSVSGVREQNAAVVLPGLESFDVEFPLPSRDVALEPDREDGIMPGSYGKVSIKSRSKLYLTSGVYYFEELNVNEPDAEVVLLTYPNAPVYIYVKSRFVHRGAFRETKGRVDHLFVGYFGSEVAHIETPLVGTFVAPRARANLKPLNGASHTGAFFARELEVDAGVRVVHQSFPFPWLGRGAKLAASEPPDDEGGEEPGAAVPDFFSFEDDQRPWTGPLTLGYSPSASDGARSLAVQRCGYQPIRSPAFSTDELGGVGSLMQADVFVPSTVDNPWWVGTVAIEVSVPGESVYARSLGTIELTPLARGQWSSVTFVVPSDVAAALRVNGREAAMALVVNTSQCSSPLLVDHLRFGGELTLGQRFGGSGGAGCQLGQGTIGGRWGWASPLLGLLLLAKLRRRKTRASRELAA